MHVCLVAVNVYLPKDRVTNAHQGYGFVEFRGEEDADYVSAPCCCCCCYVFAALWHSAVPSNSQAARGRTLAVMSMQVGMMC